MHSKFTILINKKTCDNIKISDNLNLSKKIYYLYDNYITIL
jgi:hypothetical protein